MIKRFFSFLLKLLRKIDESPLEKSIVFKHKRMKLHYLYVHPLLIAILNDMSIYAANNSMDFTVTSFVRSLKENKELNATSMTHPTGRAFDIRTSSWPKPFIEDFCDYFNKVYANVAAVNTSGKPRLCVYHNNGNGNHIHVQIHQDYAKKAYLNIKE